MHIVRTFCHTSTTFLSWMLFKSFIISIPTYCLPISYTLIHAKDQKRLGKFFNDDVNSLSIRVISDVNGIIDKQTKHLVMNWEIEGFLKIQ